MRDKNFWGWSRGQNGQRSLSFFARNQYGDTKFEYPFFDNLTYIDFEALTIRNSGQDWMRSSMKDIMLTSLMRDSELDFQEHNPVATYINGAYWGMYNMREKINEHMLASKHNIDAGGISLLTQNAEIIEGNNEEYHQLIDYIENTDLSDDANFEYVKSQIDLTNYILYQATNIYINNTDWPGNNIKFWKHADTKWRWIMFDTDLVLYWNVSNFEQNTLSFALDPSGPVWPNPPWSTMLFRKLLTNTSFRNKFINRYADELNTRFLPNNVINHIDEIYSTIEPEIFQHYTRWKDDPSLWDEITDINSHVNYYVENMKSFATYRHPIAKDHIKQQFDLPAFHPLTVSNPEITKGFVEVNNNLKIQTEEWVGDYFETVPVKLKAVAEFGYEFSHWGGDVAATSESLEILLTGDFEVTPYFIPTEINKPVVINEINYKSADTLDVDDWIELYNPNTATINISDWEIKDENDSHVYKIPEGTEILGGEPLVVVKSTPSFTAVFPNILHIGEFDFGFGTEDAVRLYDQNGTLQDIVEYQSITPWPSCANATGYTIELIFPSEDNETPESWDCINFLGSPNNVNYDSLIQISPTSQTINLSTGWAMFSTYIITNDMNLATVIYPILEDVIIVKDYLGAAYLIEWNFNGIGEIMVGQGYQIKTNNETTLEVFGDYALPENHPTTLAQGWNMIGYLRQTPTNIIDVFSEMTDSDNLLIVKDYFGAAYLPVWGFNGIGEMHPGQGYQVKVINECVLYY